MRGSDSGYAHGTSGSPQTTVEQEEYAAKVAEIEASLKEEADNAPLVDPLHIAELEEYEVKFTRKNVVFTARDATGQVVWLEKGNSAVGLEHIKARGHDEQIAKHFNASVSEVPRLIRNIIRDGKVISNTTEQRNGREVCERIYEYNSKKLLLAALGTNGFLVSAYPKDK